MLKSWDSVLCFWRPHTHRKLVIPIPEGFELQIAFEMRNFCRHPCSGGSTSRQGFYQAKLWQIQRLRPSTEWGEGSICIKFNGARKRNLSQRGRGYTFVTSRQHSMFLNFPFRGRGSYENGQQLWLAWKMRVGIGGQCRPIFSKVEDAKMTLYRYAFKLNGN